MASPSNIFEENYRQHCAQMAEIEFESIKERLGIEQDGGRLFIPFFNKNYWVSNSGIMDASDNRPDYMASVILAKYILLCPDQPHDDIQWVSFKDFKRTSHFTNVNYFSSDTERAIESHFAGNLDKLAKACRDLAGFHHEMDISYDLAMQFEALPRVSLLLLFNDGDEEFPAKCTVLFHKHSEYYLDPESLAMTGAFLARSLRQQLLAEDKCV